MLAFAAATAAAAGGLQSAGGHDGGDAPWTWLISAENGGGLGGRHGSRDMPCSSSVTALMQWASRECEAEDAFAVRAW